MERHDTQVRISPNRNSANLKGPRRAKQPITWAPPCYHLGLDQTSQSTDEDLRELIITCSALLH